MSRLCDSTATGLALRRDNVHWQPDANTSLSVKNLPPSDLPESLPLYVMLLNNLNRDMFKPFCSHRGAFSMTDLETNLASRWEGVRLPQACGKFPDFPGTSPNFPGRFSATSPEVLSLWNLTAIQRFPGSSPNFPGSSPNFPGGQPLSLGSLTPSPDSQKLSLTNVVVSSNQVTVEFLYGAGADTLTFVTGASRKICPDRN